MNKRLPPKKRKATETLPKRNRKTTGKQPSPKRPVKSRSEIFQGRFLLAYSQFGTIAAAARKAKCSRQDHYTWMAEEAYQAAFAEAQRVAIETLEDEVYRRAKTGVLKPVYYQGSIAGHIREYSDVLLMFRLKALAPDRYRDNSSVQISGQVDLVERLTAARKRVRDGSST